MSKVAGQLLPVVLFSSAMGIVLAAGGVFIQKTDENYQDSAKESQILCASVDAQQIKKHDRGFPFHVVTVYENSCVNFAKEWHLAGLIENLVVYSAIVFGGLWFMRGKA
jgi:hypothetical protein